MDKRKNEYSKRLKKIIYLEIRKNEKTNIRSTLKKIIFLEKRKNEYSNIRSVYKKYFIWKFEKTNIRIFEAFIKNNFFGNSKNEKTNIRST